MHLAGFTIAVPPTIPSLIFFYSSFSFVSFASSCYKIQVTMAFTVPIVALVASLSSVHSGCNKESEGQRFFFLQTVLRHLQILLDK